MMIVYVQVLRSYRSRRDDDDEDDDRGRSGGRYRGRSRYDDDDEDDDRGRSSTEAVVAAVVMTMTTMMTAVVFRWSWSELVIKNAMLMDALRLKQTVLRIKEALCLLYFYYFKFMSG